MVLKIKRMTGTRNWYVIDKIKRVSWGYRPEPHNGEPIPEDYDLVYLSEVPRVQGESRYYAEVCVRFEDDNEQLYAISEGYILNDDGKTIERL